MKNLHFIVNGFPQSGKDTFVDSCISILKFSKIPTMKLSSIDIVKNAALMLGWDGIKDNKGRKFLSDLKDLSTINYNGPFEYMKKIIINNANIIKVFFIFIREPQEIEKFIEQIESSKTVLVIRNFKSLNFNNHADSNVLNINYDYTIKNNGTINDLIYKSEIFSKRIKQLLE